MNAVNYYIAYEDKPKKTLEYRQLRGVVKFTRSGNPYFWDYNNICWMPDRLYNEPTDAIDALQVGLESAKGRKLNKLAALEELSNLLIINLDTTSLSVAY